MLMFSKVIGGFHMYKIIAGFSDLLNIGFGLFLAQL